MLEFRAAASQLPCEASAGILMAAAMPVLVASSSSSFHSKRLRRQIKQATMVRRGKYINAMPGYGGHVPCMRNHIVGRSFSDSTVRASKCEKAFRQDDYASVAPLTVESRPQGRDFLYAQTTKTGYEFLDKVALEPRISKKRPSGAMFHATGRMDVRTMKKVAGTTDGPATKTIKSASLPLAPYRDPTLQLRKTFHKMSMQDPQIPTVPGYTGHQHGSQHVFGRSFGSTRREIITDGQAPEKPTMKELLYYWDPRPSGKLLVEKHKMPGYQGFIPSKNNHVFAKTAGKASDLAAEAENCLKERGNANGLYQLVDNPPQGRVDLFAQSQERFFEDQPRPLYIRVDKRTTRPQLMEVRPDYRVREIIEDDTREVMEGRHHIHGYTGHVHASQHIYAKSYGKMSRTLNERAAKPSTSEQFLGYTDSRALLDQSDDVTIP